MPAPTKTQIAGMKNLGSSKATLQAFAIIPSFDQNPPMNGSPIIEAEPTNIAVAVNGILDAKPPIFSIDCASNSSS